MAYSVVTPSTVDRESVGSLTLHIATFAAGNSQTWVSHLPNVVGYWANADSASSCFVSPVAPTAGTDGYTVHFGTGDLGADAVCKLYILSRT